jgi:hypothetical protein
MSERLYDLSLALIIPWSDGFHERELRQLNSQDYIVRATTLGSFTMHNHGKQH